MIDSEVDGDDKVDGGESKLAQWCWGVVLRERVFVERELKKEMEKIMINNQIYITKIHQ